MAFGSSARLRDATSSDENDGELKGQMPSQVGLAQGIASAVAGP